MENQRLIRPLRIVLLLSVLTFLAFAPKGQDPIERLVTTLEKWIETNPQEKVYLNTDKPYYALGDTIWFKAYVTVGSRHQLSALSGAVYVELINERDSIEKSLKLPLTAGMAMGNFDLNEELKEGNYRVRAYTQWMRNAGEDYFYDRTFIVGSPYSNEITSKVNYLYKVIEGKPVINAQLNYSNDEGNVISGRPVSYKVIAHGETITSKTVKTDANGTIYIDLKNDKPENLLGAYIQTIIEADSKLKITKNFAIKTGFLQSDVQFFPEGGMLVNGVASRIGFKALGMDGKGILIKGSVLDEQGNHVADFESEHAGMGVFKLKPEQGKTYTAKINYPDGSETSVALPKAENTGYVLAVYQPNKDSILVRINVPPAMSTPINASLIAQTGGETIYATPLNITKPMTSIWLLKKDFPTGIAQFTLFNESEEPLNERIAFVKNKDQMRLEINTARLTYKSRENVSVGLQSFNSKGKPVAGNFSVTVINEDKVPLEENNEHTILTSTLLTSDIKGYVEQPNYYFTEETESVNRALDNLMLTQGYRRFTWKDVSSGLLVKPKFIAEKLGTVISGTVLSLSGKPVNKGKVTLMSMRAGILEGTTTDTAGRFKFDQLVLTDSVKFSVQARTAKNRNKVEVILDSMPVQKLGRNKNLPDVSTDITGTTKTYLENGRKQEEQLVKMGKLDRVQRLQEVKINAKKMQIESYAPQGAMVVPEGHADQTYMIENPETCSSLAICLQGRLQGVQFREYINEYEKIPFYPYYLETDMVPPKWVPMQVILNGRRQSVSEVADIFASNAIDAVDVAKIEVVRSNAALKSYFGGSALLITTKRSRKAKYDPSVVNFLPRGFNKAREFYSPRYDRPGINNQMPDYRSTIYWNPSVRTFDAGKTTFDFFNADGPGNYKVIVEGINAAGELGRQVYRYKVEGGNILTQQPPTQNTKEIVSALQRFHNKLPEEKAYLHTDKPYYNLGDTIWFKAYVFDPSYLSGSQKSGLLYVELNDDSAEVVRRISIPIKEGLGWGQIPLPAKIFHEGGYTLRAYTNWMQNFGDEYLFNKRFYLGKPSKNTWLVKSDATVNRVAEKDQVKVNINLMRTDKIAVGLRDVGIRVMEADKLLFKDQLRTTNEGDLALMFNLKEKADGNNIRIEINNLSKNELNQVLSVPLNIKRQQNIDLQFLPEGGELVAGLKSLIGFKAIAEDGKGVSFEGDVYDSKGNVIAQIASLVNGMGSFEFLPKEGETYTARLNRPLEVDKSYSLPLVKAKGTGLHVINNMESDLLEVNLMATPGSINADDTYYLVGTSRGIVCYAEQVDFNSSKVMIAKSKFASGIARFTLLKEEQPLNERVVFIDHEDQARINISPNKASFLKRDSVGLSIEMKDVNGNPVVGSFSVSVTDDSQVLADSLGNHDIATSLLLNAGLKGTVETPGYYLNKRDKQTWKALDNLMLTQGWTGYKWKDVFDEAISPKFAAEKDFRITGKVTNILKKPVSGAQMLISSQKPFFLTTAITDQQGGFMFTALPQIDSGSFFIQARTPKGKTMNFGEVEVDRQKFPPAHEMFRNKIMPWYVNTDTTQLNYVKNKAVLLKEERTDVSGIALKEVKIMDKKIIKGSFNQNGLGKADLIFDEKDIKESGVMSLYQLLKQKVPGFRVAYEDGFAKIKMNHYDVTISVDGRRIPLFYGDIPDPRVDDIKQDLEDLKVATLRGLEVMYSRRYTAAYDRAGFSVGRTIPGAGKTDMATFASSFGTNGGVMPYTSRRDIDVAFIELTTYSGAGWHRINKPDVAFYRPLPILYPQEFYRPKYVNASVSELNPDLRATIHWEPNMITDAQGKAKISFYTTDIPGSYTVTIEGSNMNGIIGSSRYKLLVPKPVSK
ncbi:hypothetical protein CPT03_10540 [Pedobacter ginsengisoli]|uniref:Alpha-2-macroglobulin domain-containing protein n=1 Tax=Pedobacter ginsengisoli TaxID=363852 RepID=A0A2D1U5S4_9SPHI|nr:hypothetical protein [Pedobacter ginsengisoli]ATP56884.1 hypothetical protein CPT03_10540 [Pedobacter ginsengisoli]